MQFQFEVHQHTEIMLVSGSCTLRNKGARAVSVIVPFQKSTPGIVYISTLKYKLVP